MKPTVEINDQNFQSEVVSSSVPVVVDFWAEWCGPCKMIAPVLDQIAGEYAGRVKIAKVNIDHNNALAQQFHIQSIPTLLYFNKGQVKNQTIGAASKKAIVANIESMLAAG